MSKRIFSVQILIAVLIALAAAPSATADVTSIVVFGDSLSDNGNLYAAAGMPTSPPYFNGRFSNGPVTVERLATLLGVPLYDFAWGGATTGTGNYGDGGTTTSSGALGLPGMLGEFGGAAALVPVFGNALFVVWGGPNDVWAPSPLDTTAAAQISRSVANLMTIVTGLQGLGATHILVPGMPDLGLTPEALAMGPVAAAGLTAYTNGFNNALAGSLPAGVLYFDTAGLMRSMVANPAAYGLTNVTDACLSGGTACANPADYLFWDGVHPTTTADAYLADGFAQAAVPEPGAVFLLGGVLVLTALRGRFRRR